MQTRSAARDIQLDDAQNHQYKSHVSVLQTGAILIDSFIVLAENDHQTFCLSTRDFWKGLKKKPKLT